MLWNERIFVLIIQPVFAVFLKFNQTFVIRVFVEKKAEKREMCMPEWEGGGAGVALD